MNSTRVVTIVRRALNKIKVGHGGTLDPLAEGILPLALGDATKTVSYLMNKSKTYEFAVSWGAQTTTDDLEGDVIASSEYRPTEKEILDAIPHFTGHISQVPPNYSAVMVDGKRAYDLARKSSEMELKSRVIEVTRMELKEIPNRDTAVFRVTCGKGTYIRSIARDIALHLGTCGHVSMLKRTNVGNFSQENAICLEKFRELGHKVLAEGYVCPIVDVLDDIPAVCVSAEQEVDLMHGRIINLNSHQAKDVVNGTVLCIQDTGKALAIGTYDSGFVKPNRVFNKTYI